MKSMIKLIIWFLSFWKPFEETFNAWYFVILLDDYYDLLWYDLAFFQHNDWWDYMEDDYTVQKTIRRWRKLWIRNSSS